MKKILALGDSTTFGAELSDLPARRFGLYGNDYRDNNGETKYAAPSQLAWPSLLAQKLNAEVINLSLIGGSNDRIFRLAIEHTVLEHWDLVICAWTSVDRFDITDGKKDLALSVCCDWGFSWIKDFVATHYNRSRADVNFVTKLITLQSYFAQRQQPYLFAKSLHINFDGPAKSLQKNLDLDCCVDWDRDFYSWACNDPRGSDGHLLEQGHHTVANTIYNHVMQSQIGF